MNLRLRLIVAFFLLSVVPLAALTLYAYTNNVQVMRDAAGHEAELLAAELSQRMEIVTAQLSQRVERLMDMTSSSDAISASARSASASPASQARVASPPAEAASAIAAATSDAGSADRQVTAALGDLALLINNVELRGLRGRGPRRDGGGRAGRNEFGGPQGPPPSPPQAPSAPSAPQPPAAAATTLPGAGPAAPTDRPTPAPSGAGPSGTSPASGGNTSRSDPFRGGGGGGRFRDGFRGGGPDGGPPPQFSANGPRIGAPGTPPPAPDDATADPNRIRIDMGPIRDELVKQLVPDGRLDQLSAEDRARVFAEVNQRMLGIRQGIQMLQEKVAEKAADAKAQAPADAAAAKAQTPVPPSRPAARQPTAPTAPASSVATQAAPAALLPASVTRRKTEISGTRMDIRLEQNGQLVGQANAEINLPNLLSTVFTTTRRDRGEVPFAVAKDGRLFTPTNADKRVIEGLNTVAAQPGTPAGTTVLPEWVVVTTNDPTGSGLKFGIARPVGDALADLQRRTARNAGFGLGFIGLALIGIVPLSSRLTRNLSSLSDGVRRIAQGDYHARVEVRSNDEVGRLARAFNQMASDVETHQRSAVEQERLRRELELGRQIQHDMLPQVPLRLGLTEIKGVSVPAREVGGDFFNYFQLANGTIALLVGDVSGKGVGAALLMANIQASLRTRLALGQDLAALARELDRDIEGSTPGPVYATLFVGILDPVTRVLRCVNAGHNPQYVLRQQSLERMESTGLPIGLISGHGYTEQRVQLAAGDLLFFYTDGCVEAENGEGEMFGTPRLEAALLHAVGKSADALLTSLEDEVSRFRAGKELFDDATMMVVKVG
jgi:serine phosphatase RsbU (regulator of sigma subunit)